MTQLAAAIANIPIPEAMLALPLSRRGFPVPWFVAWIDGEPDFRVSDTANLVLAVRRNRCWLCGGKLGRVKASVIGPMCAVNRVTSEPPSHLPCARYALRVCPFLTAPRMRRNERDIPVETKKAAGIPLDHNPGLSVLWLSLYPSKVFDPDGSGGILFDLPNPYAVEWWTEGRHATRAEAEAALARGLPNLVAVARDEGPEALAALAAASRRVLPLLPP